MLQKQQQQQQQQQPTNQTNKNRARSNDDFRALSDVLLTECIFPATDPVLKHVRYTAYSCSLKGGSSERVISMSRHSVFKIINEKQNLWLNR